MLFASHFFLPKRSINYDKHDQVQKKEKRCRSLFTTRLMINQAIIYLIPLRSGEEIQEEEREEESYIVCYIGHIRIRTFLYD